MREKDVKEKIKRHLTPALVIHTGIVAAKSGGLYVEGSDGRRYLDFSSGLAVTGLGHCHPAVVKAAKAQLSRFMHSGCIFHHEPMAELAERLAAIAPGDIEMFFFSNSGAEAVEGAIKLARFYTGRPGIVSFMGGFHGRTYGALTLTTSASRYRKGYQPLLPAVYHAPYPYCFRCHLGHAKGECDMECADYLERIFKYQIPAKDVACVVIEPVLGEGGYVAPPLEFMRSLREICDREGILLVADEVQSGFGRTGRWFACEHFGITPDIMTMAKGIASGLPLSAVGSTKEIMSKWPPGAHGTTFGGNPVSCAAACATIDTIEKEGLLENAARVGAYALDRLDAVKRRNKRLGDVRGLGLMIGVELIDNDGSPDKALTERVVARCLERGLVLVECGVDRNVIRLMPPLTVTEAEMDKALEILEEAFFE